MLSGGTPQHLNCEVLADCPFLEDPFAFGVFKRDGVLLKVFPKAFGDAI